MNKKRLLVVMLIVLALSMFVACDDSPSTALEGTWIAKGTDTETFTMAFKKDATVSLILTETEEDTTYSETTTGTYTYTDSTFTITGAVGKVLLTSKYSITKSGSTVTLKIIDEDDDDNSLIFTKQ